MATPGETCDLRQMCSLATRVGREDPIGSASVHERCLLAEVPTPWERKVTDSPNFPRQLLAPLQEAENRGLRVQFLALMPEPGRSVPGYVRVLYFERPTVPFAAYQKLDYLIPNAQLEGLVHALLLNCSAAPGFERYRETSEDMRDLLVCTHGARDACCAKFGYPLYRELRERYVPESNGGLRAWRVSHIGGHRFAPTLIDMPHGRYWARLDEESLDAVVRCSDAMPDLRQHYRGWGGLTSLWEQAAERAALEQEGWGWVSYPKWGEVLASPGTIAHDDGPISQAHVRIHFTRPGDDASSYYEATVQATGETALSKGSCSDTELKESALYRVTRLELVSPASIALQPPVLTMTP